VLLLAMTSGALDAVGFLGLGGVFASVMTGNLVLLGLSGGTRDRSLAVHAAVAIGCYVAGVAVGTRVVRAQLVDGVDHPSGGRSWSRGLQWVVAVELVLVIAFAVGWELARSKPATPAQLVLIGLAATAMGLQGAAIRASTGAGTSTTYLTGTLTGVVATLVAGRPLREEWEGVAIILAALAGALLAGTALTERSGLAPVVPLVALAGALVVARTLVGTGHVPPVRPSGEQPVGDPG
jgi:uncharacterized membrane protein YoaK (UPF0700 family)